MYAHVATLVPGCERVQDAAMLLANVAGRILIGIEQVHGGNAPLNHLA